MKSYVYSFDVYDTCLVRHFARPSDLFLMLAKTVLTQRGSDFTAEEVVELARWRLEAASKARALLGREEVTLDDIYQYFQNLAGWGLSAETMMQAEIRLECASVAPILTIKRKIQSLREQGHRVIFISDMYLPRQVIQHMLLEHGLALPDDPVYVSGEIGLTKQSGKLFQHILTAEQITPKQLWHHGDNPYADVLVPHKLGIRTSLFQQSQLNRYEQLTLKHGQYDIVAFSRIAGISRRLRLEYNDATSELSEALNLAANVIAPLLTCFVAWVLQDACKKGIKRLYFVSRDGQILFKIARQLEPYMPAPECRYLYGSRQAWLLSSVFDCHRKNLEWLVLHSKTPQSLLQKLEIVPDEIKDVLTEYQFDSSNLERELTTPSLENFWRMLESPKVSALVLKRAAIARQMALAYFEQEGLSSAPSIWAIVDVGWALRGQAALKQILGQDIQGYYLALSDKRKHISETGGYRVFIDPAIEPDAASSGEVLLNHTILIEHLFLMADHSTVITYRRDGHKIVPVFRDIPPHQVNEQFVAKFHQVILCYAAEIAKTGLLETYGPDLKRLALWLSRKSILNPTRKEAEFAAHIPTVVDQTHHEADYNYLAKALNMRDWVYMARYFVTRYFLRKRDANFTPRYNWFEGSLVISSFWMRLIFLPIKFALRFKQTDGRWLLYKWMSRFVAKEVL